MFEQCDFCGKTYDKQLGWSWQLQGSKETVRCPDCAGKESEQEDGNQNKAHELIKELVESDDTYDLRFWPNKEISKESIEIIASEKYPEGFDRFWISRIAESIKEITQLGGAIDSICAALIPEVKEKCKKKAEYWWKEQSTFYKKCIEDAVKSRDVAGIEKWLGYMIQHYEDYCLFCKHAQIQPRSIPSFIEETKLVLKELKANTQQEIKQINEDTNMAKTRQENNSGQDSLKSNSEYQGRYPDEPATQKQIIFLTTLCKRNSYTLETNPSKLTRKQISELISQLLAK
jgi:hypothetical protein